MDVKTESGSSAAGSKDDTLNNSYVHITNVLLFEQFMGSLVHVKVSWPHFKDPSRLEKEEYYAYVCHLACLTSNGICANVRPLLEHSKTYFSVTVSAQSLTPESDRLASDVKTFLVRLASKDEIKQMDASLKSGEKRFGFITDYPSVQEMMDADLRSCRYGRTIYPATGENPYVLLPKRLIKFGMEHS